MKHNGGGALGKGNYQSVASKDTNGYYTIKIPLSAVNSAIDFTKIQYFDFPNSNDSGAFDLQVASIKFDGGATTFDGYTTVFANNSKSLGWPDWFDVGNKPNLKHNWFRNLT